MLRLGILSWNGNGNVGDDLIHCVAETASRAAGWDVVGIGESPASLIRLPIKSSPASVRAFRSQVRELDALLIAGGGFLNDDAGLRNLVKYAVVLGLARSANIPIAAIGLGFGPVRSRTARKLASICSRFVDAAWLRDASSLELWNALRPTGSPGTDTAFAWEPEDLVPVPKWDLLVVPCEPRVGAPTHRASVVAAQRQAIQHHLARGARVAALPFQRGDGGDDLSVVRPFLGDVEILGHAGPHDATAVFRSAGGVLSGRLHAAIVGALADRPQFVVDYHSKVTQLAQTLGLPILSPGSTTVPAPERGNADELLSMKWGARKMLKAALDYLRA